jgi:hypothetical protein
MPFLQRSGADEQSVSVLRLHATRTLILVVLEEEFNYTQVAAYSRKTVSSFEIKEARLVQRQ